MPTEAIPFVALVLTVFASLGLTLAYAQWATGPGLNTRRGRHAPTRPAAWRGERTLQYADRVAQSTLKA